MCRTGRPEFKREMQRKVDSIKECLRKLWKYIMFGECFLDFKSAEFKGTPDPLRGDEPNRRVREAAKVGIDFNSHFLSFWFYNPFSGCA